MDNVNARLVGRPCPGAGQEGHVEGRGGRWTSGESRWLGRRTRVQNGERPGRRRAEEEASATDKWQIAERTSVASKIDTNMVSE